MAAAATVGVVALALVVLLVAALLVAYVVLSRRQGAVGVGADDAERPATRQRDLVLMVGPSGGGKTVLLHQIMRGRTPVTVTSLKASAITGKPASDAAAPTICLTDMPGVAQLKGPVLSSAPAAAAIVFVLDASAAYDAAPDNHFRAAADLLYDLLTLPALVEARPAPPPLLLALNKADRPGARTVDTVQAILEAELERLKTARPAVTTADDSAPGSSAGGPLLLGTAGEAFSFARDAPMRVSWCSCIAAPGGAAAAAAAAALADSGAERADGAAERSGRGAMIDDVVAFIVDAVAR